jgi:large repetitive protein
MMLRSADIRPHRRRPRIGAAAACVVVGALVLAGPASAALVNPTSPAPSASASASATPPPTGDTPAAVELQAPAPTSGTPTLGEARSEEPSATTIDEDTGTTAEEAEEAPADDPAAQRPAADEPLGITPLAIPPATGNNAVINVSVGGDRTGTATVPGLGGVQLGLYANALGGSPLFTCTSDSDGDCSFVVPNTQNGGANRDERFWVRHVAVPAGWLESTLLRTGSGDGSNSFGSPV